MKAYLAGPDVFHPDAAIIGSRKKEICRQYGIIGSFPLDNDLDKEPANSYSRRIFRENLRLMDDAEAIIANLTPFRGPSADPGTVFELGYMAGQRKICSGYSNLPGTYAEKVMRSDMPRRDPAEGRPVDQNGLFIENFNQPLADNLMIVHALDLSGYPLITVDAIPADLWHDLSAFEKCVQLVSQHGARQTESHRQVG